ncbi:glycosyltransferase [Arachnia propionica]|uniref:Glycosyltransferase n=1 Tax=Arachnia propionica TaxID=1750 RepID=A0A3P1WQZ9_9ACTN|nr:glycosyltransferase [Arachnia propionica]RRD49032.1 glycosyltransferase [Arachnia propionica]
MEKQPTVVWVTSGFPYGRGEQFIETELPYWTAFSGRLTLLPENSQGAPARPVPDPVEVDTRLLNSWHRRGPQALALLRTLGSRWFWREIVSIFRNRKVTTYRLKHALLTGTRMTMELRTLREMSRDFGHPIDVVYSYWMSVSAWAACLAKRRGLVRRVVSRAHSGEFYEVARPEQYNAYVRQFAPELDTLALISEDALAQARHYGFSEQQLQIFRLGVEPGPPASPTPPGQLSLISVSTMSAFKQLHLMISAIRAVAAALPSVQITWHHAGDGPLRDELTTQAERELGSIPNLRYHFLGHVPNEELMKFYESRPVDLFLNSSKQEGVPVSIMEAMTRSIPTIAPDAGAIREVVAPELLIPRDDIVKDLTERILSYHTKAKEDSFRAYIRDYASSRYSAASNYGAFVEFIDFPGKPQA